MKKCLKCLVNIEGRQDKRFCSDKCRNNYNNNVNPSLKLFNVTKARALKNDIPFNIEVSDIIFPEVCPLLDIPISKSIKHMSNNSPSLDKIIPELGYVKGNVWIISMKANRIKSNLNKEEMIMMFSRMLDKLS